MTLKNLSNQDLFQLYDSDLKLRLRNSKDLNDHRHMLARFQEYLGDRRPTPELGKVFLSQYVDRKCRTLARYSKMIGGLIKFMGDTWDFRVRVPRSLPRYTEDDEIERLLEAIGHKKTHKGCIVRDRLMEELFLKSGMRRGEMANLEPKDIHSDLDHQEWKGSTDRVIPLPASICLRLQNFIQGMNPNDKVFKLKAPCIGMKIKQFARRAVLNDVHTHTFRHKYATNL